MVHREDKDQRSIIQLKSVSKIYKMGKENVIALDSVNLDVDEGEFVAIMGPSGSGKSTLANVIGGLDKVNSGTIIVDGQELNKLNDKHLSEYRNKKVGFVFQAFNLIPIFTAQENVTLPLILTGVSSKIRKQKAYDCLKIVGLEGRVEHKPSELSGGERQRVSIARALVNEPKIIIADEPTGNLDSKKSTEIISILKKLNVNSKITLIVITHDPNVAHEADRILNMQDGKISR
jgi:putative ABC transport system ATP-binding protein